MLHHILNKLFRLEEINGGGRCPTYLYRWTLLRRLPCGYKVYLHHFVGDDWSLAMHDHPKRFWTVGLRGSYVEETPIPGIVPSLLLDSVEPMKYKLHRVQRKTWRAPWVRTFPAEYVHRVTTPKSCWTLVVVGPSVREWGFHYFGEWRHWREFVNSREADNSKSCG